jgi:hypothetical protein
MGRRSAMAHRDGSRLLSQREHDVSRPLFSRCPEPWIVGPTPEEQTAGVAGQIARTQREIDGDPPPSLVPANPMPGVQETPLCRRQSQTEKNSRMLSLMSFGPHQSDVSDGSGGSSGSSCPISSGMRRVATSQMRSWLISPYSCADTLRCDTICCQGTSECFTLKVEDTRVLRTAWYLPVPTTAFSRVGANRWRGLSWWHAAPMRLVRTHARSCRDECRRPPPPFRSNVRTVVAGNRHRPGSQECDDIPAADSLSPEGQPRRE